MQIVIDHKIGAFIDKLAKQNLFLEERNGELLLKSRSGKLNPRQVQLIKNDNSIISFIKGNKPDLVKYLKGQSEKTSNTNDQSNNIEAMYELSPVQEGMLFHGLYDNGSNAYTEQYVFDFFDGLDVEAFKRSTDYVVNNHSILRSSFIHDKFSIPVQCVYKKIDVPFQFLNYSNLNEDEQAEAIGRLLEEDEQKGFDFSKAPLLRITFIRVGVNAFKLVWTHHHILLDGWSMPIVMGELIDAYEAYGRGLTPPPLKVDNYETFIKYIKSKDQHEEEKFWKNYLQDFDTPSLIPFVDNKTDRNKGGLLKEIGFILDADYTEKIRNFAQSNHLTVNTMVQGTWALLLSRYIGNQDTAFGVTVSGRPSDLEGAEQKVGMFINTLPLRTVVDENKLLVDWLTDVQKGHTAAREYQYSALSNIQSWCNITGDFFDSIIVFENYPMGEVVEQESLLNVGNVEITDGNNYLLSLIVALDEKMKINFSFNKTLLDEAHVEVIMGHFKSVIQQMIDMPAGSTKKVGEIDLLSDAERALILGQRATKEGAWFNEGFKNLNNTRPINVRFEELVEKNKDAIALVHHSETWTYEEVNDWSNQIAHYLSGLGLGKGDLVGVFLDRGIDLVSTLLGIMKCGAVYIPLDTQNPKERIEKMIKNSEMALVVTDSNQLPVIEALTIDNILLMDVAKPDLMKEYQLRGVKMAHRLTLQEYPVVNPKNRNEMDSWAYLLFTSGTTGEPKAAITRHNGALNHILAEYEALDLEDGFRFLQSAGIGSDISLWQILAPLLKGGAVVVIDKDKLLDINYLLNLLKTERISIVEFVPSYIWSVVEYIKDTAQAIELPDLRWIMMVGEAIPVKLVNNWRTLFPQTRILNGYGPCEASDDITQFEVKEDLDDKQSRVPIGRPIANMNLFVLDQNEKLCPIGVAGELAVSGVGVGAGYYKMPEKTASVFIENPFPKTLGNTIYKTGDLGRWLPNGNLEFLGRIDRQVKIRGHRVELGEIESFIREDEQVADIHVVVHKENVNKLALVAFVISNEATANQEAIERELRNKCQNGLPNYMHPAYYCFIDKMPVNLSDKIDDKKLLKHFASQDFEGVEVSDNYQAPRNDIEWRLVKIWSNLLKTDRIGVQDNFFDIGGNSLIAIRLMVQINKTFDVNFNVSDLFELPTINLIMQKILITPNLEDDSILKVITKGGSKQAIFCVPGAGGNSVVFGEMGKEMGEDQPFYSFIAPGLNGDTDKSLKSIEAMAELYVKAMQEVDPYGPYILGGYSMGGMVAYEMGLQLEAKGFEVSQLIMFDAAAPGYDTTDAEYTQEKYDEELIKITNEVATFFGKEVKLELVEIQGKDKEEQLNIALEKINESIDLDASMAQLRAYMEVGMDSILLERSYQPEEKKLKEVPILIIRPVAQTEEDLADFNELESFDENLGWESYTSGKITSIEVSGGDHESFLNRPHVEEVVQYINRHIETEI